MTSDQKFAYRFAVRRRRESPMDKNRLDPVAVFIVLHLHTQEPIMYTARIKNAIKHLLKKGLIYKTSNNGVVPYGNSAIAHELCCNICDMSWPKPSE